jgi:two-component system, NtrC family, sensor histidine kinase PilS
MARHDSPRVPERIDAPRASVADESFWTSLTFFAIYRILVGAFFFALTLLGPSSFGLGDAVPRLFAVVSGLYLAAAIAFLMLVNRTRRWPWVQLTAQIVLDIVVATLLIFASGGFRSGLGVMLLIALAAAALMADRRTALFYAALASLAILFEHSWWALRQDGQGGSFVPVGFLALSYFATTIIVNRLSERVVVNERIARERGLQLANQLRINDLVLRDVQDGVLVVDAAGHVVQHNAPAGILLGVRAFDGEPLATLAPTIAAQFAQWREGDELDAEPVIVGEHSARVRLRFQEVGVDGVSLAIVFIEDWTRLEGEAQKMKLVALGRLTANIAHEIRNPLSAITHAADLIGEENRIEGRARLARIMRDNAHRLDRMVRDVLELNRRDRAQLEPIELAAFVTTFVDEFAQYEKAPTEVVTVEIDAALVVSFDRVHLHQILWNLVRNAWRHGSRGPSAVRLRAIVEGASVELHVIDDGPGVPQSLRGQLFEPFFTTAGKGTGLGLYIARELAVANGASLEYMAEAVGGDFRLRVATDRVIPQAPSRMPSGSHGQHEYIAGP